MRGRGQKKAEEGKKRNKMDEQAIDKRNYDVVSIKASGKQVNHIRAALKIDHNKITIPGKFINVFSDLILKKEQIKRSYM